MTSSRATEFPPPTHADISRYRLQFGTNLGSVCVLERWLTPSMFPAGAKGESELAAVTAWIALEGVARTKERFENHWATYVSEADLDWLRDSACCNAVRLPIGHFTLGGKFYLGTPFAHIAGIYENAWSAVRALVGCCWERGIGVLIDFPALPGGANGGVHSGTDSGRAEFWASEAMRKLAGRCLGFIVEEVRELEGVIGVQIVNEAESGAKGLWRWYEEVLEELGKIDANMPVYVSDAWTLPAAIAWAQRKNSALSATCERTSPVVIDTHLYWCFSDQDKQKTPQQIWGEVHGKLSELDGKDGDVVNRGGVQVVVGEWSCVIDDASWARNTWGPRDQVVRRFGNAQDQRFQQRASGLFFWTYRMDWMPGGEWGFKNMIEQCNITPPKHFTLTPSEVRSAVATAKEQRPLRKQATVAAHRAYWDAKCPAGGCQHWRFEYGWDIGFSDAMDFFEMRAKCGFKGADKIGMLDLWVFKRLRDCGLSGNCVWEFEHGVRQGAGDFYDCVGI